MEKRKNQKGATAEENEESEEEDSDGRCKTKTIRSTQLIRNGR